ncbi:MAG TPA: shikimate dehydrogenase [Candidimonas sp.]|nr:shikimate dehydrogenase [Candidimonas sp.]
MTANISRKRYAVVGNPVAHSRSPFIHRQFASQTGIALEYATIQAPVDAFEACVADFFANGGSGLNITVPFKERAFLMAQGNLSPRAQLAGAVNTLWSEHGAIHGCNTDGVGLLGDLLRLGHAPAQKRILLIGAGGAARGAAFPLLEAGCAQLCIVNRSAHRATQLATDLCRQLPDMAARISAGPLECGAGTWDIVINATSTSLTDVPLDLPGLQYAAGSLAYDLVYAAAPTPFMRQAQELGATSAADGLGMLVGQAAASFAIWHGTAPEVEPVLLAVRDQLIAS